MKGESSSCSESQLCRHLENSLRSPANEDHHPQPGRLLENSCKTTPFLCATMTHNHYYISVPTLDSEPLEQFCDHNHPVSLKRFVRLSNPPLPCGSIRYPFKIPAMLVSFGHLASGGIKKKNPYPLQDLLLANGLILNQNFHGYTRKNKLVDIIIIILEFFLGQGGFNII